MGVGGCGVPDGVVVVVFVGVVRNVVAFAANVTPLALIPTGHSCI